MINKHGSEVKKFKVVAVSTNTNSFGLHNVILVAQDGEAYQAGHSYFNLPIKNDIVELEVLKSGLNWGVAGFEIPEKKSDAPAEIVKDIWR